MMNNTKRRLQVKLIIRLDVVICGVQASYSIDYYQKANIHLNKKIN